MIEKALYPHQREAIRKLKSGSILCGDTGTGKSRTALAYYFIHSGGQIGEYFGDKDFIFPKNRKDLYIITTAQKRDKKDWESEMLPFLLTAKKIDSWNNIKKYKNIKNAFFIFDEQHLTGSGVWVKSFYEIAKFNEWILLSATPGDTWSDYIPVFVANGFFRSKYAFEKEHVVYSPYAKFPKIEKYLNTGKLLALRNQIVVKMPYVKDSKKLYYDIQVGFNKDKYLTVVKRRWDPYKNEPIQEGGNLCYLLRRVCNEDVSRLTALGDIFLEHPKLIVFYSFNYELDNLRAFCDSIGVDYAEWNGHKHEPLPTSDKWIYLVNYTSGGEGWNCTQTDTLVLYSLQYSYKVAVQAEGRIDRMNTPFKFLYYYRFVSKAPIDLSILDAYKKKKVFNEKEYINKIFSRKE